MYTVYHYFPNVLSNHYAIVVDDLPVGIDIRIINLTDGKINSYIFAKTPFYANCYPIDDPDIIRVVNLLLL